MDLAWISLAALVVVIVVSCTTAVNPGFLAIVLAWVIGVYLAPLTGRTIGLKEVIAGFPAELFLTLVGVTLCSPRPRSTARWSGSPTWGCGAAGATSG